MWRLFLIIWAWASLMRFFPYASRDQKMTGSNNAFFFLGGGVCVFLGVLLLCANGQS